MPTMDAVALLENMWLKVKLKVNGVGKVKRQSISLGKLLVKNSNIALELK